MQQSVFDRIRNCGVVPVVKLNDISLALPLAQALLDANVDCIEVTFRAEGADKVISAISTAFPQMLVGAGTVLSVSQAHTAINVGAKFCVAPGLNPAVVDACNQLDTPIVPGVHTCTEIETAMQMGLKYVKFFPAEQSGGLAYIKAVCAPYSGIDFMPTGGINQDNLATYLSFKRVFACGGSWMVSQQLLDSKDFATITQLCKKARQTVIEVRG